MLVGGTGSSAEPRVSGLRAGAKAFEWQQEIGLNQARRSGEVAMLDNLLEFDLGDASSSSSSLQLPGSSDASSPAETTLVRTTIVL